MPDAKAAIGAMRIGVSLSAFRSPGELEAFRGEYRDSRGREPLFELAYSLDRKGLDRLRFIKGNVLSVHAPCPGGDYFPNFGSDDPAVRMESLETLRTSAGTAVEFGAGVIVLHPGYTTDRRVPMDSERRLADVDSQAAADGSFVLLREGSICRPEYCVSPAYARHMETTLANLESASSLCAERGLVLAIENLNPRISYLFQLPSEFAILARRIPKIGVCIDIGHLWISSIVHGFEFAKGLAEILATRRVVSAHVHDNGSRSGSPPVYGDDHALIGSGNVPVRESLRILREAGVPNLIVETKDGAMDNLDRVEELIDGSVQAGSD